MSLSDLVKQTVTENAETLVENTAVKKSKDCEADVEAISYMSGNKKYQMIVERYKQMNTEGYWKAAIKKMGIKIEEAKGTEDFDNIVNVTTLVFERAETAFKAYGEIVKNPMDMDDKLKKLKAKLKKYDEEIAGFGVGQVELF